MGRLDPFLTEEIVFNPDTHQYFNLEGEEYTSVSRCLRRLQVPFDRNAMSYHMAMKESVKTGENVTVVQQRILAEWEKTKDSSIDKGNYCHDGLETYAKTGKILPKLEGPVAFMQKIFKDYYRFFPEATLFSHKYKTAGRTDIILQRQKNTSPVYDFGDYKSNESKGIVFDSISRKSGELKHFNKFLLPPFDYLEDCNYTIYSLQLSMYAFMAMDTLGIRVGKLFIVFIDNNFNTTYIPVPFMYHEAKVICEMNTSVTELPSIEKKEMEEEKKMVITDDW